MQKSSKGQGQSRTKRHADYTGGGGWGGGFGGWWGASTDPLEYIRSHFDNLNLEFADVNIPGVTEYITRIRDFLRQYDPNNPATWGAGYDANTGEPSGKPPGPNKTANDQKLESKFAPAVPTMMLGQTDTKDGEDVSSEHYQQPRFMIHQKKQGFRTVSQHHQSAERIYTHILQESADHGWHLAQEGTGSRTFLDPRARALHNKQGFKFLPGAYAWRYILSPKMLQHIYLNCKSLTIHQIGFEIVRTWGWQQTFQKRENRNIAAECNNFTYETFADKRLHAGCEISEDYIMRHLPNDMMTISDFHDNIEKTKFYLKDVGDEFPYCYEKLQSLVNSEGAAIIKAFDEHDPYLMHETFNLRNYGDVNTFQVGDDQNNFKKIWNINKTFQGPYMQTSAVGGQVNIDIQPKKDVDGSTGHFWDNMRVHRRFQQACMFRPTVQLNNPDRTFSPASTITIKGPDQSFDSKNIGDRLNRSQDMQEMLTPCWIRLTNLNRDIIGPHVCRFMKFQCKYFMNYSTTPKSYDEDPMPTILGGGTAIGPLNFVGSRPTPEELQASRPSTFPYEYKQIPVPGSDNLMYPRIMSKYLQATALQTETQNQSHKPEIYGDSAVIQTIPVGTRQHKKDEVPFSEPVHHRQVNM